MSVAYERADQETADAMEEALTPPNKIDGATGLPFGWSEDDELDGLGSLLQTVLPVEEPPAK